jgi:ABC-type multidrug transport system ATPase subunit
LAFIQRGRLVAQGSPQEIKETHMSGEVLEIDCATPDKAIHILRDMDLFDEVALYGAQIHVVTTPDADARAQSGLIAQALADEQVPVQSIERIVPSLEDVFIASVS